MRRLAAALALLCLVPAVQATSPTLPFRAVGARLDGEPRVGAAVELVVEFAVDLSQAEARLHGSPSVEVLDNPLASFDRGDGDRQEHRWRLRIREEGFWSLALSSPQGVAGPCCGNGWSSPHAGAWDLQPAKPFAALPDPDARPRLALTGPSSARLVYAVDVAPWLANATLVPQLGPGTVWAAPDRRAMSLDDERWEWDVPSGTQEAHAAASYRIAFPEPVGLPRTGHTYVPHTLTGPLHCENFDLVPDGEGARIKDRRPCGAGSAPAPSAALAALSCLAVAAARRPRRPYPSPPR